MPTYDPTFAESRVFTRLDAVMGELHCTMMAGGIPAPAVASVMAEVRKSVMGLAAVTFNPPPKGKGNAF